MKEYLLPVVLGVVALLFFVAKRSIGLFAWSRLEVLSLPRSREKAVESCLEQRELVITCFAVAGNVALVTLAVLFTLGLDIDTRQWPVVAQAAIGALLIAWVLPELIAWAVGDWVVLYLVPALYQFVGVPFRALRMVAGRSGQGGLSEAANGEAETPDEATAADREAREVFKEAVRLQHTPVREIMTPRTDMISIANTATLGQAAELSLKTGTSRLPVYKDNRDHIIGVLHVKDLLQYAATNKWSQPGLPALVRPPVFVPETKTISELLDEFRRSNTHLGIVLDEYGGTSGLVTLEDMLEELIGEIYDEHEAAKEGRPLFKWIDKSHVGVQAVMRIEEFSDEFDFDLPDEDDFDTIGGFVMSILGKIPVAGESFHYGRARFTVLEADVRHVVSMRVDFDTETESKENV